LVFVELPAFIRATRELFNDEDIRALQNALLAHPDVGDLIFGAGGVRKMRWAAKGKGKRSGARIIYFYAQIR
jgi:hypothetical protein